MTEPTVMALPIIGVPDGVTPLAGLVVMKVLDTDGNVAYLARATEGLSTVECLGMAHYAVGCLGGLLSE